MAMSAITPALVALVLSGASPAAPPAPRNAATLRDLPDNSWIELAVNRQPDKRNYSGMTFDTDRGVAVMWGGGHGSYPGNEVEEFEPVSGVWRAAYPPLSPPWAIRWAGAYLGVDPRGFPFAWHTYHDLHYDPPSKQVLMLANGGREVWRYTPATAKWTLTNPNGPTGMLSATCAYDTDRREVLVVSRGTFLYNPATDTFKPVAAGPNPYNNALCYDPGNRRYIYFGKGTWTYDPGANRWQDMAPKVQPPERGAHALAFDTANGVAVLFGGDWQGKTANDTWTYDLKTNSWTEMKPKTVPPWKDASFFGQFVYDPAHNVSLAVWGHEWRGTCQTWAYRYKRRADEEKHIPSVAPDLGPDAQAAAAAPPAVKPVASEKPVNGPLPPLRGAWTKLTADDPPKAPTRRWLSGAVYDRINDRVLYFGAAFENYSARPAGVEVLDPAANAWESDAGPALPAGRPPLSLTFSRLAFDTKKGVMVYPVLGGHPSVRQTWTYDAKTLAWTRCKPPTQPDLTEHAAAAYHEAAGLTLLFGGRYGDAGPGTWALDSATHEWRDLKPAHSPGIRMWHAMTYDAARQVVVLFGGWGGADDLDDTWEFDPKTNDWTRVACAVSPSSRSGHGMTYDARLGHVLLFGGNRGALRSDSRGERLFHGESYWYGQNLNDTWAYDGARQTWRPIATPSAPPAGAVFGSLLYDPKRDRTVLINPKRPQPRIDTITTWALAVEKTPE
jgi:hypothetical protein